MFYSDLSYQVGYSICDVGISIISYTMERAAFIDYSHPVGVDAMKWMSKPPQKLPPATNIIRIFDTTTWAFILVSMLAVSVTLVLASYVGLHYGVGTTDTVTLLFSPFQTLNAEPLPSWFSRDRTQRRSWSSAGHFSFLSPGFTGNYLLLMWAVMGSLITMAFMCNIRAMLMKPVFQKPIDSTKDIFTGDKITLNSDAGSFWPEYLKTSTNEWERLAGETGSAFQTPEEREEAMIQKIYQAGSHVSLENPEYIAYQIQKAEWFKDKQPPIFHISQDVIRSNIRFF